MHFASVGSRSLTLPVAGGRLRGASGFPKPRPARLGARRGRVVAGAWKAPNGAKRDGRMWR